MHLILSKSAWQTFNNSSVLLINARQNDGNAMLNKTRTSPKEASWCIIPRICYINMIHACQTGRRHLIFYFPCFKIAVLITGTFHICLTEENSFILLSSDFLSAIFIVPAKKIVHENEPKSKKHRKSVLKSFKSG